MEDARERERVHVGGSLVHCPFCKDELAPGKPIVACAACGARHHQSCHDENGRCATCGSPDKLVAPAAARKRSRSEPLAGSKIKVSQEGDATVYSWRKGTGGDVALALFLGLTVIFLPLTIWVLIQYYRRVTETIRVTKDEIEFPAAQKGRVKARREDVGRVQTQFVQQNTVLFIDVGIERHMVKTALVLPTLKPPELEWLADQLNAWKDGA